VSRFWVLCSLRVLLRYAGRLSSGRLQDLQPPALAKSATGSPVEPAQPNPLACQRRGPAARSTRVGRGHIHKYTAQVYASGNSGRLPRDATSRKNRRNRSCLPAKTMARPKKPGVGSLSWVNQDSRWCRSRSSRSEMRGPTIFGSFIFSSMPSSHGVGPTQTDSRPVTTSRPLPRSSSTMAHSGSR